MCFLRCPWTVDPPPQNKKKKVLKSKMQGQFIIGYILVKNTMVRVESSLI